MELLSLATEAVCGTVSEVIPHRDIVSTATLKTAWSAAFQNTLYLFQADYIKSLFVNLSLFLLMSIVI